MRNKIVKVPSIKNPIAESPGFAKKQLSDYKLDACGLCGFGCAYCSSNVGNYLWIWRKQFAEQTKPQLGESLLPAEEPALMFILPDYLERLRARGIHECHTCTPVLGNIFELHKPRYLLYDDQITEVDRKAFRGLEGVLLQSKPDNNDTSLKPHSADIQREMQTEIKSLNCAKVPSRNTSRSKAERKVDMKL
jgi:hypothetical protein